MIQIQIYAPELWSALTGILELQGDAFVRALTLEGGIPAAVVIVLAAGLSEAFGQSIVLFANRVKPARLVFSLFVDALLFGFGYAFLVLSTWLVCRLPNGPHIDLRALAILLAMSYAPMLFAFLSALPYLGSALLNVLRVWHFLAMVVAVGVAGNLDVFAAAAYVWLGWLVMSVAQRSFGKPIATLGSRLLDAVAGVKVLDDAQVAIGRVEAGGGVPSAAPHVEVAHKARPHPRGWIAILGLGGIALLAAIVALALEPVRQTVLGWQSHLPRILQLPLDLVWLGFVAFIVAAFMAPFETLGWWAGWYGDEIDTRDETRPPRATTSAKSVARYIVYLDGIAQSSNSYTPDIETFLDALSPELPSNVVLVRGVMAYSVLNKPLEDDPLLSRFWRVVDASRSRSVNSLLGWFINLRNVTIVAVSADPRYGPMYNFGMADVIYRSLIANGYSKRSGIPVTLVGYSGGGQMACGSAPFLKRALDAPVDVISLGGVISGNDPVLELEHLYHLVGDRDGVERLGPIMFSSRWPIAVLSYWNRAKRLGTLTQVGLGPVGHQVPGGMLDPGATLADGRTYLRQTLDYIESIVAGRFVARSDLPRRSSNYARYVAGTGDLWKALASPASDPPPGANAPYVPAARWIGRMILPQRDERFGGALFEVSTAPREHAALIGSVVRLCWSEDRAVRDRVRAAVRDVSFSAEATSANTYGGLVMPERINRWRLVDPLESLAGAHPHDDVVVKLAGTVTVDATRAVTTLRIEREPVQITGRYRGLITFLGPVDDDADAYRVLHYDRAARKFAGDEAIVAMPAIVADSDDRPNSVASGIERSPLNEDGWFVAGAFGDDGRFVVQSLAPRALLRAGASRTPLRDARDAYHYVRRDAWRNLVQARGSIIGAQTDTWNAGDTGLVVHTYGGIGGKNGEKAASGPFYFGHFAYGVAEVVQDELADEPRFDVTYYQVYTQNSDGLIAGALDWSRYMADRQYGWAGVRPVCDALLRLDSLTQNAVAGDDGDVSPLGELLRQLEVMTARYRIGDGTGGTFVGAANNCSQDSNRALFAALRTPAFGSSTALQALVKDLQKRLQLFGGPRRDWSDNRYNLGTTIEDAPLQNLLTALGSWRCILPRLAFNTIVGTFLRHGASVVVFGTDQIGGERTDVAPVPPTAF